MREGKGSKSGPKP